MQSPLRFGILGAARIAPKALVVPATQLGTADITRIAARDRDRAEAFAAEHDIANVSATYQEVIEADDVDVVYNPLPMHLHAKWTIAALRAGKHVLCEKPFASNADEAVEMVAVAEETGQILGEAFHHRYHPLWARLFELLDLGVIGTITRAEGFFNISIPQPDIRWDYATSGGSLMDLGCYSTIWVRHVLGEEPMVTEAAAVVGPEHIDGSMWAELAFPSGATGRVESSMINTGDPEIRLEITGTKGSISVENPLSPYNANTLTVRTENGETSASITDSSTYVHMLRAFCDHVVHRTPFPTSGDDSISNMVAIDAIYTAAGLPVRATRRDCP